MYRFKARTTSKTSTTSKKLTLKNHQHSLNFLYSQTDPQVSSNKKANVS